MNLTSFAPGVLANMRGQFFIGHSEGTKIWGSSIQCPLLSEALPTRDSTLAPRPNVNGDHDNPSQKLAATPSLSNGNR
jgi:hypothetical protein